MLYTRLANICDIDLISQIEQECFSVAEACPKDTFIKRFNQFSNGFMVLEEDGKVIGFVDGAFTTRKKFVDEMYEVIEEFKKEGDYVAIYGIALKKEYQKKGYGAYLLNSYIEHAKKLKAKGLVLASRPRLVSFYKKSGFIDLGLSSSYHGDSSWYDMILEF